MFGAFKSNKKAAPARILVVDDEPDCLSIIQCRLEWCNYEVFTAGNGAEGLQIAENEKPDIVLLDTNMPVMDGREMLVRMRKHPILKDTPVIMVTAICGMQDIEATAALGIADYVTKPVDFTSLLEKISNILGNGVSKSDKN
ncbi:MAG: response regulator [Planctomycetota bacterium]|jgi:two-component system OmpR family response regulator